MAKKSDIKQFRQACTELRMSAQERRRASLDLHADKRMSGVHKHMDYGDLLAWLRQWRQEH
ncbi:MAG TPA: hypothetical protein VFP17_12450 [Solirubrobacterales bacterium]|nr:hypothetical protein [Solirubrobacterales bacterium]